MSLRQIRTNWRHATWFVVAILGQSCSATIGPDAGDAGDDRPLDRSSDGLEDPPAIIDVVVGRWLPLRIGDGFSVRAENAAGSVIERTTDPVGRAELPLNWSAGPWDLTIARPGFQIVSIIGVAGQLADAIYIEPIDSTGPSMRPAYRYTFTVSGRSRPDSIVQLQATETNQLIIPGDSSDLYGNLYVNQHRFRPIALELDATVRPYSLLNGVALPITSIESRDSVFDLVLPGRATVLHSSGTIHLPTSGAVAAADVTSVYGWVEKTGYDLFEANQRVGLAHLERSTGGDRITWNVQYLAGDLLPDSLAVGADVVSPGHTGSDRGIFMSTDRIPDGATFEVPPAEQLRADGTSLSDLSVSIVAPAYRRSAITVDLPTTSGRILRWTCHSFQGADLSRRQLPHLPTGMTLQALGAAGTIASVAPSVSTLLEPGWAPARAEAHGVRYYMSGSYLNVAATGR